MNISSLFSHPGDNLACVSSAGSITYDELYQKSENLAKHIVARNVSRVIVYGHKEHSLVLAYIACLRAGAAYIPVSVMQPVARRKSLAAQSGAGLVLCAVGRGFAGATDIPTENILTLANTPLEQDVELPESFDDDTLAYIIFTSGSTGAPKGVKATHRNLNNFIDWVDRTIALPAEAEGAVLNLAMFSIDLSMVDIYYALSHGRTLVTTTSEQQEHLSGLYPQIETYNPAMMVMTPTLAEFLMRSPRFSREMAPNLRVVYLSGESLHPGTVRRLLQRFDDDLIVYNGYGPTEATCNVSAAQITDAMCDDRLPVGIVATAATQIRIIKDGIEQPDGEEGEIVLLGDSVTAGYEHSYEEDSGFHELDGKPAYYTGDIGFKTTDGRLFWSYRKNSMIKVKGFRLEPGDVENHMCRIRGVTGCGVVERYGHLVAYVTLNREMTPGQVRAAARSHLPPHLIPGIVRIIDKLPMTKNGKLDRDSLE